MEPSIGTIVESYTCSICLGLGLFLVLGYLTPTRIGFGFGVWGFGFRVSGRNPRPFIRNPAKGSSKSSWTFLASTIPGPDLYHGSFGNCGGCKGEGRGGGWGVGRPYQVPLSSELYNLGYVP